MSAQEAVSDALAPPVDQNAEAAADAKKLLAELDAEDTKAIDSKPEAESNDAPKAENGDQTTETKTDDKTEAKEEKLRDDRHKDRRDRDNGDRRGGRGRGRGGRGGHSARENIKSVLTVEEPSSDHDAIRKQVEFYFSDSNLPMDQFLLNKVGGSLNNPVELELIRTFKRMRHFEPLEAIIEALKTSKTVNLVDNDTKIQRKQPLAKALDEGINTDQLRVYEDKAMPRSVYVKGFGPEIPSTQFDIEAFFANYGPTNAIRLRRTDDKLFKGSVFVEFENEELAASFLALDPKPKYQDRELQIMSKKEYCDKKVDDIRAGKIRAGHDRGQRGRDSRDNRRGGRGGRGDKRRRDDDDRDWRTRRDEDRKNGFRDDKRRDRGDRDDRDKRSGGRERRKSVEKDDRGIPVVKSSTDTDRDAAKEDAIAKARAAVEQENGKENGKENGSANDTEEASKKRQRTDDADAAAQEPATKKVDVKSEA